MRQKLARLVLLVAAAVPSPGDAHVGPSPDVNNRYYKVTPMADRVRVAYTVFFGEIPGQEARRSMDQNRDGMISMSESEEFARGVLLELRKAVFLTLDGQAKDVRWHDPVVGLGDQSTRAGSFAVDFVGFVCSEEGPAHSVGFREELRLPQPGESELRVELSPGIGLTRAVLAGAPFAIQQGAKWTAGPGPAAAGLELAYSVSPDSLAPDNLCLPPRSTPTRWPIWLAIVIGSCALITLAWRHAK